MADLDFEQLISQLGGGNPAAAQRSIQDARGDNPGFPVDPRLQGMDPSQLAQLDRYAQGAQMAQQYGQIPAALSGAVMGGGYEAMKGLSQVSPWIGTLLSAFGSKGAPTQVGGNTSPASWDNIKALLEGTGYGGEKPAQVAESGGLRNILKSAIMG